MTLRKSPTCSQTDTLDTASLAAPKRRLGLLLACSEVWLLLAAITIGSGFRALIWKSGPYDRFGIDCGRVFAVVEWWGPGFELALASRASEPGWRFDSPAPFDKMVLWPHRLPFWGGTLLSLPLWIPLGLAALALWRAWAKPCRRIESRCPCGYELTGNISGRCPECGRHCETRFTTSSCVETTKSRSV